MPHLYDVIFLGESLASRMAAALLARQGKRLLVFKDGESSAQWLFGSFLLDEVLTRLGARSSAESCVPLQIITAKNRLDLNGPVSLAEELEREFPRTHLHLLQLLNELSTLGGKLEKTLLRRARLAAAGALRKQLGFLNFQHPKARSSILAAARDFGEGEQLFLTTLFEGLACAPIGSISQAEAALLWRQVMHPLTMNLAELERFLDQRFEQFRGSHAQLCEVKEFTHRKNLFDVLTKSGAHCRSPYVVFGSDALRNRFLGTDHAAINCIRLTVDIQGQISPLLARRIVLSGAPALRLMLGNEKNKQRSCTLDIPERRPACEQEKKVLLDRLGELFPFTSLNLRGEIPEAVGFELPRRSFPATEQPFQHRGSGTFLCQGVVLWPRLGTTAEVLAGLATADLLCRKLNLDP